MKRLLLFLFPALTTFSIQSQSYHFFSIPDEGLGGFFRKEILVSAHRGGPVSPGFPENCLETFDHTLSLIPAVIEFDVEMSKDSVLLLLHDNTLDRTTTGAGPVAARNWAELQQLRLKDNEGNVTDFRIPLFADALQWTQNRGAVLTVDVKRNVPYYMVVEMIQQFDLENRAAVITYNAADAAKVHALNPRIVISANMRNLEEVERTLAAGIPPKNLLAFVGTREPAPELYERLKVLNIPAILGTLGNLDNMAKARGEHTYRQFVERGAGILATDRPVEAYRALHED